MYRTHKSQDNIHIYILLFAIILSNRNIEFFSQEEIGKMFKSNKFRQARDKAAATTKGPIGKGSDPLEVAACLSPFSVF